MKRHFSFRTLSIVLCVALFIGTFSVLFSAANAAAPEEVVSSAVLLAGDETDVAPQAEPAPNLLRGTLDWFFRTFGFVGFILDPYQFTIINQKPVFQFFLGFNDFYDTLPWVMNVWTDTIKCHFNYEGKDWRIQFWKGGYGLFFSTGGEIGIYTKPENQNLAHYNPPISQSDWLDLTFTIYNRGNKLFTRPSPYLTGDEGPYWWASGYRILSICTDFLSNPRKNVVMDATINFKNTEMASLFLGELIAKGFTELTQGELGLGTPERYQVSANGRSVQFIWQNINEGIY